MGLLLRRPEDVSPYKGFWGDIQQRVLSLRHLLRCIPPVNVNEGLTGLRELSLEEALAPPGGGTKGGPTAALLKTAVAILTEWGIRSETQTTGGEA